MVRKHIFTCVLLTVIALLVGAWILNFFGTFGVGTRSGKFDYHFAFLSGTFLISKNGNNMAQGVFWRTYRPLTPDEMPINGGLSSMYARLSFRSISPGLWRLQVPIILLITALIPLLVGSLSRFRFRLWQFFAFTALVAMELAYFLR